MSRTGCCDSRTLRCITGKKLYKYWSVSHTNRSFLVLGHQCIVTSRRVSFGFVCVWVFLSLKAVSTLTDIIWLTDCNGLSSNLCLCSTEETKSPTSWILDFFVWRLSSSLCATCEFPGLKAVICNSFHVSSLPHSSELWQVLNLLYFVLTKCSLVEKDF